MRENVESMLKDLDAQSLRGAPTKSESPGGNLIVHASGRRPPVFAESPIPAGHLNVYMVPMLPYRFSVAPMMDWIESSIFQSVIERRVRDVCR